LNGETRPRNDGLDKRRDAGKDRRGRDAQRWLGAHGLSLDAVHALGADSRNRLARAHHGPEHTLLRA
jgi:hypothetical protein